MEINKAQGEQTHEAQTEEWPESEAPRAASPVPAVASGLVGLILEHDLRKGRRVEIPSLGIVIPPQNGISSAEGEAHARTDGSSSAEVPVETDAAIGEI